MGVRIPPIVYSTINDLRHLESLNLIGLSQSQVMVLFIHLRSPDSWCHLDHHRFTGEESFLHFMVYLRIVETKLRMSTNYFGGDSRRFTYSIRLTTQHFFTTFCHKISGDSMSQWVYHIDTSC